jgi:hypothetical protein
MTLMATKRTLASLAAGCIAVLFFGEASGFNLNKSIRIDAGSESDGQSTVNGSITVGSGAVVNGALETVNGTIRVDENARIEDAQTVNGSIRLGSGVTAGEIESVNGTISIGGETAVAGVSVVNGKISLEAGARVSNDVGNVNGEIGIAGAEIGGDLTTVNGDVSLTDSTVLRGNLTVEEPNNFGWGGHRRKPRIVVGPGVRVEGDLVLEHEVELYISDSAEIGGVTGVMSLDDAIRFSGDRP